MSGSAAVNFKFEARSGQAYEQMMGRWSRILAPLFIQFSEIADGDRILDVGCGTGSLTFALPAAANVARVAAIDRSDVYVEYARSRNTDPRISIEQSDASVLPFADDSFDRALSMLVLQFIPEPERVLAEMRRVVRSGGTLAAAVWDSYGGMPHQRMMWDTAAVLDPEAKPPRSLLRPIISSTGLADIWRQGGLRNVEQTSVTIRNEFANFDDYWQPYTTGEGGAPSQYIGSLSEPKRVQLKEHLRRAYESNHPDGPRSFIMVAWACKGIVP